MDYDRFKNNNDTNGIDNDRSLRYDAETRRSTLFNEFNNTKFSNLFLMRVYQYYISGGFNNIIIKQITNLLNTIFLVLITLFLFNCVEYNDIISIKEHSHLAEFINWDKFFKEMGFFSVVCFIMLIGFTAAKLIKLRNSWTKYKSIQYFYNTNLEINDCELNQLKWDDIVVKLGEEANNTFVNSYTIANQIMKKDNYIIAMVSNKIIDASGFTKLIETSFIYCIIDHLFDINNNLRRDIFNSHNKCQLVEHIKRRLKIMAFLYVLFMPFIFIFALFQSMFKYGEKFYKKPELLGLRAWSVGSHWIFREYNEMEHFFKKRLFNSNKFARRYVGTFYATILDIISRFIIFILSGFLIILIITSVLNENVLLKLYISKNQTVLWYIGVFGSLITVLKMFIQKHSNHNPNECMAKIIKEIKYLPDTWIENAQKQFIKNQFVEYYPYQVYIIIKECMSIIMIPYILWKYCENVNNVVSFIINSTVHNEQLGLICYYAVFEEDTSNIQEGNASQDNIQGNLHDNLQGNQQNKLAQSIIGFKNNNLGHIFNIQTNQIPQTGRMENIGEIDGLNESSIIDDDNDDVAIGMIYRNI